MSKCFRCGQEDELKNSPSSVPVWGNKPLCRRCYAEVIRDYANTKEMKRTERLKKKVKDVDPKFLAAIAVVILVLMFVFLFLIS
jgi:hypothetical protein